MIVIDANLLIHSYDVHFSYHQKCVAWLEDVFSGTEAVGLPWQSISAFLRVVTNKRLPGVRVAPEEAVKAVEEWLHTPHVKILVPGDRYWALFRRTMIEGQASGPLVSDAEVAALTLEYGGTLYTTDRDFARFPGLQWVNPLSP